MIQLICATKPETVITGTQTQGTEETPAGFKTNTNRQLLCPNELLMAY